MKMMIKWLHKKFREIERAENKTAEVPNESNYFNGDGMNIKITSATGGKIVEYQKRKPRNSVNKYADDEFRRETYIITEEENFVESFSKITSMELMR